MGPTPSWSDRLQRAWLERGAAAALLPLAWLFGALAASRRGLYRAGMLRRVEVGVPVVVVGNLIAGGAGKTPTVLAVVRLLQRHGRRPGIVSRGHGRTDAGVLEVSPDTLAQDCGDEPLLLRLRAGVPVCVARDRVAAAQALRRRHPEVDVIVSDDGLQHLRLARDLQIIVFDERGAGNGWLLPAGPLREPLPATPPPRSLVLYNAAVLAEVVKAGILALPKGQPEAAYAIGLRKGQTMGSILLPQAVTAMLPAIVSQLVVIVKDTALGGVMIGFTELLNTRGTLAANYANPIASFIVIAILFIVLNFILTSFASWLEQRLRRGKKSTGAVLGPAAVEGTAATGAGAGVGMGGVAGGGGDGHT